MPLILPPLDHAKAIELEMISSILDQHITILDHILEELNHGRIQKRCSAPGMTAE